jgi:hypothetical protein
MPYRKTAVRISSTGGAERESLKTQDVTWQVKFCKSLAVRVQGCEPLAGVAGSARKQRRPARANGAPVARHDATPVASCPLRGSPRSPSKRKRSERRQGLASAASERRSRVRPCPESAAGTPSSRLRAPVARHDATPVASCPLRGFPRSPERKRGLGLGRSPMLLSQGIGLARDPKTERGRPRPTVAPDGLVRGGFAGEHLISPMPDSGWDVAVPPHGRTWPSALRFRFALTNHPGCNDYLKGLA